VKEALGEVGGHADADDGAGRPSFAVSCSLNSSCSSVIMTHFSNPTKNVKVKENVTF